MSAIVPIDALADLTRVIDGADCDQDVILMRVRAALAELIEQSQAPAVAFGCLSSTGVHFVSDDRDECVEESRRDGSLVVELIVRPFALSRMQGVAHG